MNTVSLEVHTFMCTLSANVWLKLTRYSLQFGYRVVKGRSTEPDVFRIQGCISWTL